ncbi:hypothetical protein PR202_gb25443 [Eleusine coracana subsp. coracana]|uniref:F-box domain-containing protein n=1 Tax=Eleusine coracana subsp. coracana TaxID=191504 RepID=A0AAV5FLM1_ELECO|nr:hypothetical protein QOZ80_8BG0652200 [Eleusine coracana subsp. coracana]GJN36569.1 hypothetical protein PR202_gb25443 [Eleusine coracana subsp. coracana]
MSEIDPAAACLPVLPEDVVTVILDRVPDLVSLFRCSVVCKRWRRLVSDPVFLRRRWPEGCSSLGRPSLLGFFVHRDRINTSAKRKISRLYPSLSPVFVPVPDSVLGPERRFLTSFIRDDAGILDDAKPLVARGGLLLVRITPRSLDKNNVLCLCMCNLLTGRRELLPPLDASLLDDNGVTGYSLVTAADHDAGPHPLADGYSNLFQVLLIGVARENWRLHLYKFSSAAGESQGWHSYDCRQPVSLSGPFECRIAVVACGTSQWLFQGNDANNQRLYTLDVSINSGHISLTFTMLQFDELTHPIGSFLPSAWLCTIDARLALLCARSNQLEIWSRLYHQNGTLRWHPTQSIRMEINLFGEPLSPVCFIENSDAVLVLYHSDPEFAYLLDLQFGSVTKVAGWTRSFNYMTAVSYEIN